MARSSYKHSYYTPAVWKKIFKSKINVNQGSRLIFSRSSSIPRSLIKFKYFVHNGSNFNKVLLGLAIVNKKFGEFSTTRKPFFFPKKIKQIKR